jgi:hypothetical protein
MLPALLKVVLLFVLGLHAFAASADYVSKLAVLSLVGDTLTVVNHRPEVGSQIDRNQHESVQLVDAGFDKFAIATVAEIVNRADSQSAMEVLALTFAGGQDPLNWFDGKKFEPPAELRSGLSGTGATHLLLITQLRATSNLKTAHASVGSGYLQGLGFYIDREKKLRRADTGERGVGFLAPYAYFKVFMIDLATGQIEGEQSVTASSTFSAARNADGVDPWDAIDPVQKVSAIRRLIRSGLIRVVPELLRRQ